MSDFKYEVHAQLGTISQYENDTKEVNYISYNGASPKIDIRKWTKQEDGSKRMSKGITLTLGEAQTLLNILQDKLEGLPEMK